MKKIILAVMILAIGLSMGASQASAFSLIDPASGEMYMGNVIIKYDNYDFGTVYGPNQENGTYVPLDHPQAAPLDPNNTTYSGDGICDSFGIATVTSVQKDPGSGNSAWDTLWNPSLQEGLEVAFWGLDDFQISADGKTLYSKPLDDAYFRVYLDKTPDMDMSTGMSAFPNNVGNAGDELLLDCRWVTGISSSVPQAVYQMNFTDYSTNPPSGWGAGYLEVVGGSLMDEFDTNGYLGGTADFYLKSSFYPNGDPAADENSYPFFSHDPIKGSHTPEPATMAIFGMGLFGLGASRKIKKRS